MQSEKEMLREALQYLLDEYKVHVYPYCDCVGKEAMCPYCQAVKTLNSTK